MLYNQSYCDVDNKDNKYPYGCKNFEVNFCLKIFYGFLCIYFLLSAYQIRYGFPLMRRASSVLQYDDNPWATIGAQIYGGIPFAIEIRCLLDFWFNKTSLDIFQFWQLFQYHLDLYCAKNGNISYSKKVFGAEADPIDKFIFGFLISMIIMALLIGPFFLFSEYGGLTGPNPVTSAQFDVSLVISKTV